MDEIHSQGGHQKTSFEKRNTLAKRQRLHNVEGKCAKLFMQQHPADMIVLMTGLLLKGENENEVK